MLQGDHRSHLTLNCLHTVPAACWRNACSRLLRLRWAIALQVGTRWARLPYSPELSSCCSRTVPSWKGKATLLSPNAVLSGGTITPCARCMRKSSPCWKTYTGTSQRLGTTSVSRGGGLGREGRSHSCLFFPGHFQAQVTPGAWQLPWFWPGIFLAKPGSIHWPMPMGIPRCASLLPRAISVAFVFLSPPP